MERIKNMGLKKSFFFMSVFSMAAALLAVGIVFTVCIDIASEYPAGGVCITYDGVVRESANSTWEPNRLVQTLEWVKILACIFIPVGSLGMASFFFYHVKLKKPIAVLRQGTEHIRRNDLSFRVPEVSGDELGQVCAAFETMRKELVKTNKELWRQAEERKRLNAAFSHDLRNPVTVLKGTVQLLRQGIADEQALERLETYVHRIEQYVDAMSNVQRLEQIPVQKKEVRFAMLRDELEETVRILAPALQGEILIDDEGTDMETDVHIDHGIFLTVAENLIGNGTRFARNKITISLAISGEPGKCGDGQRCCGEETDEKENGRCFLVLTVADDGDGFPEKMLREGPQPFGKMEGNEGHFGMGLYTCRMLCRKHGGSLVLENGKHGGARVTAVFR